MRNLKIIKWKGKMKGNTGKWKIEAPQLPHTILGPCSPNIQMKTRFK